MSLQIPEMEKAVLTNAPSVEITTWGCAEILESIDQAMENDISYLELVFLIQDKIVDNTLDISEDAINSIAICLDVLEDIFSNNDERIAAEFENAALIEEILNRIKRIALSNSDN